MAEIGALSTGSNQHTNWAIRQPTAVTDRVTRTDTHAQALWHTSTLCCDRHLTERCVRNLICECLLRDCSR
jgi:hypothetical protein